MATKRYQFSGARIQELRVKRGWSRERLADDLGMAGISVERYERGRARPSVATLIEIAHRLHVAPGAFFVED